MSSVPGPTVKREISKSITQALLGGKVSVDTILKVNAEIDESVYTTSDPTTILAAVEAGLCGEQTGSMALGFSKEEHIQAKKDHAERAARVAQAQASVTGSNNSMGGDPAARGVPDLSVNPQATTQEKKQSRDRTLHDSKRRRVRGRGAEQSGESGLMNITQESVNDFVVGHGGADALDRPIVAADYARKAYKGVYVRAATANTVVIYIGAENVAVADGYPLPAGQEFYIPIENPSKIYVVATPANNSQQTIAITGSISGDTFTLTLDDETTVPIATTSTAAVVQAALQALTGIGVGNCTVTDTGGGPPYTVTFNGGLAKVDVDLMTGTSSGVNEVQNVTVAGGAAGDTLTLTFGVDSTDPIAYNSTSAEIQTALEGLTTIGTGNVAVTDGTTGWDVEFVGTKAKTDVGAISGVCGKNEKQTITVTNGVAGDKMVLTYSAQNTSELEYNDTKENVEAALKALAAIGDSDVVVTDHRPSGWVVEFTGLLANTDVGAITGTCGKNEKQTIVVTGGTAGDKMVLTYSGQPTSELDYGDTKENVAAALKALSNIGDSDVIVTDGDPSGWVVEFTGALAKTDVVSITGVCGKNEKQTITLNSGVSDGTFTLTFGEQVTTDLACNVSPTDMQTALRLLSSIGGPNVSVTAGAPGWVVEFIGTLARTDVGPITGDGTNLVGDVKDVTVTELVKGHSAAVGVTELVKGNSATVGVVESVKGHGATVTVTESQKGDASCSVTVAKVADITLGSQYSWLAV